MDFAMGAMGLGFVLTLRDEVSNTLDKIRSKLLSFKGVTQNVLDSFDKGVKSMMSGFSTAFIGKRMFGFMDTLFGESIQMSQTVEFALASVRAVANTTEDKIGKILDKARYLGRTTQYTTAEVLQGTENLIRAGQAPMEAYENVEQVLRYAVAETLTLDQASQYLAQNMNMFARQGYTAEQTANILSQASRSFNVDAHTMAESMKYAGVTANTMNISLEETAALLGMLGNAGIRGTAAGTAIRNVLPKLVEDKTIKKLNGYGVKANKNSSYQEVFAGIGKVLAGMSPNESVSFLQDLFKKLGQDAGGIFANSMQVDENGNVPLVEAIKRMYDANTAVSDMAAAKENTYVGAMNRLKSATQGLQEAIGDQLIPAATKLLDMIANVKNFITDFIRTFPTFTKVILGTITTLLTFGGTLLTVWGILKMFKGVGQMWGGVKAVILDSLSTAQRGILGFKSSMLGIIGLAGILYAAYKVNFLGIQDLFRSFSVGFDFLSKTDENGHLKITKEEGDQLRAEGIMDSALKAWRALYRTKKFFEGFVEGFLGGFNAVYDVITGIADALESFSKKAEGVAVSLGLLDGPVSTASKSWTDWGKAIGYAVSSLTILWATVKTIKGIMDLWAAGGFVKNLWNTHPYVALLAGLVVLITTVIYYWDDLKAAFKSGMDWISETWTAMWDALPNAIIAVKDAIVNLVLGIIEPFRLILEYLGLIEKRPKTALELEKEQWAGLGDAIPSKLTGSSLQDFDKQLDQAGIWRNENGTITGANRWNIAMSKEQIDTLNRMRQNALNTGIAQDPAALEKERVLANPTAAIAEMSTGQTLNQAVMQPTPPQQGIIPRLQAGSSPSLVDRADAQYLADAYLRSKSEGITLTSEDLTQLLSNQSNAKNDVKVEVKPMTNNIYLDNQLVGQVLTNLEAKTQMRSGETEHAR